MKKERIKNWLIVIGLCFLCSLVGVLIYISALRFENAKNVNNGTIVDKQVRDVAPFYFMPPNIKYEIIVKVLSCDNSGNKETYVRTISVPEQVYLQVNIGDYIDDLTNLELKQE